MFITFNEFKAAWYIIHYFPLIYQFRLITHLHLELRHFHLLHTTIHYLKMCSNLLTGLIFPREWNRTDVLKAIDEAYHTRKQVRSNKYRGITSTGIKIEMYLNSDGTIATAYPLYKK
ncbi:EndoU domain-containing protein [Bacillus velezensis]|uniref:EndoU domain-containing protein n=2 Tax=Bacillus velezensis TaxID=492670 RepID=UPI002B4B0473|nr:EndoU domain-containing protein [Bacillus velezensis]